MVYVGIDIAKDKHDCFIVNSNGEVLYDVFTIQNNMDGFEDLSCVVSEFSRRLVQTVIADVQHQVAEDHDEIDHVEDEHVPLLCEGGHIRLVHELGGDARHVAEEDEAEEGQALALGGAGSVGFDDVEGPGEAEAHDHHDLKYFRHFLFLFLLCISGGIPCRSPRG